MGEAVQYGIGAPVSCSDGPGGRLAQVVVDPVLKSVTHLVVEPRHGLGDDYLVPVELVASVDAQGGRIHLRCTTRELDETDTAEETRFLPGADGWFGYEEGQVLAWPYYGVGFGGMVQPSVRETLPPGEVAIQRGDQLHATDGYIGRVKGLVVDVSTHRVTHVLLHVHEGHLWGRKRVAIPIGSVTSVDDGIQVNLSKRQVQELPRLEVIPPATGDAPPAP